ncbi:MAG: hypothetical protein AB7G28_21670 [Pirellulales bacterium]
MDRRRFTFWLGFGLFTLSDKLRVAGLDSLAAAAMRTTEAADSLAKRSGAEHWTVAGNENWNWFERENLVKGEWVLTGTTTPVNKKTGARKPENRGFLDDSLVPADVRASVKEGVDLVGHQAPLDEPSEVEHADHEHAEPVVDLSRQLPSEKVRARHGRPPSKWLRSLHADELRVWLRTIEVPEAGVSGMTVWTHLTRDHMFADDHIEGLSEKEQFKLHAAAHYGY